MQMITEVGVEQNTTTIILMPSEFVTFAKSISDLSKAFLKGDKKGNNKKLFSENPMLEVG